jgi:SnoaL-like domain
VGYRSQLLAADGGGERVSYKRLVKLLQPARERRRMRTMTEITPAEQADRLAIRQLVDAYARCDDRRLSEEQKSLFTEDTHCVVYMNGEGSEPTQVIDGREDLRPVFEDLNRY